MQQKNRSLSGPGKKCYPAIFKLTRNIKRYLKAHPECCVMRCVRGKCICLGYCVACKKFVLDKPGKTHNCRIYR